MTIAIAQHLNVAESAIIEVQEWAHVLWVRIQGIGARFVSKKVAAQEKTTEEKLEAIGGSRWSKGSHDRIYFHGSLIAKLLGLSNSKARQINAAKFFYNVNTGTFEQGCYTKCYDVTDRGMSGIGRPQRQPYWVEAITEAAGI